MESFGGRISQNLHPFCSGSLSAGSGSLSAGTLSALVLWGISTHEISSIIAF